MIKNIIKSILAKTGYKIQRLKTNIPIDIRSNSNHPISLMYLSSLQPVLVSAPIKLGRGFPLFSLSAEGSHPYILAIQTMMHMSSNNKNIIKSVLQDYYNCMQPKNAAELLGLELYESTVFLNEPSWGALMPWQNHTISAWKKLHKEFVHKENLLMKVDLGIEAGWAWVGPVNNKKLNIEVVRLKKIYDSINQNGYKRNNSIDGDITADVLVGSNGEWCWQAIRGQHRAVVLCAIETKEIPIRIERIIRRDDVDLWPGVQSGLFRRDEALKVFDMIMSGDIPQIASNWSDKVQNKDDYMRLKRNILKDE